MNIKKKLEKIKEYVKQIEGERDYLDERIGKYERVAYEFVNNLEPNDIIKDKFKKLLGDILYIGGDISNVTMEKIIDNVWIPIEHEHPEYAKTAAENARLREQLLWHPVSEKPKAESELVRVDVILKSGFYKWICRIAYYDYLNKCWFDPNSYTTIEVNDSDKWCYIPDDNQGDCTQERE